MDYILGAISLGSLVLNFLIYKRVTKPVPSIQITLEPEPVVEVLEPVVPMETETAPMTPNPDQGVYQGWRNVKDIPWIEPIKPPAVIKETSNRGPLARPDGFV